MAPTTFHVQRIERNYPQTALQELVQTGLAQANVPIVQGVPEGTIIVDDKQNKQREVWNEQCQTQKCEQDCLEENSSQNISPSKSVIQTASVCVAENPFLDEEEWTEKFGHVHSWNEYEDFVKTVTDKINSESARILHNLLSVWIHSQMSKTSLNKSTYIQKKIQQLQDLFAQYIPKQEMDDSLELLRSELCHQTFLFKTSTDMRVHIEEYLEIMWTSYQLHYRPLNEKEIKNLSDSLLSYQIKLRDCRDHDPIYQYLEQVAGGLGFPSVDRLLNTEPMNSFSVKNGVQIKRVNDALREFFQNTPKDKDGVGEITDEHMIKDEFKRHFMKILIADPLSSRRYVFKPELTAHRNEAYFAILRNFHLTEKQLPMIAIIKNDRARLHFASITVAYFIRSGVMNPKRWLPRETNSRALRLEYQSLYLLKDILEDIVLDGSYRKGSTSISFFNEPYNETLNGMTHFVRY